MTISFFEADGGDGLYIWRTDGTAQGTFPVFKWSGASGFANDAQGLTKNTPLVAAGANAFFFEPDPYSGAITLYVSDSNGVVQQLKGSGGGSSVSPYVLLSMGSDAYFLYDDGSGLKWWVSDGTTGGTRQFADIVVSAANPQIVSVGDNIYFAAGGKIWMADGAGGANLVFDTATVDTNAPHVYKLSVAGGRLFFAYTDSTNSYALGVSDGTTSGTQTFSLTNPQNLEVGDTDSVEVGGKLYFLNMTTGGAYNLYVSDGTVAGTTLVDLGGATITAKDIASAGGKLFFRADDGGHGDELWVIDGSGPHMVADINPGSGSSVSHDFVAVGDDLYFTADDHSHGAEFWVSDGTTAGTHIVEDVSQGENSSLSSLTPTGAVANDSQGASLYGGANGVLYLGLNDGVHNTQLWTSDGTPAGTQPLAVLNSQKVSANIYQFGNTPYTSGDGVIFPAFTLANGLEPWISDGTPGGTHLLADLAPGITSGVANPGGLQFSFAFKPLNGKVLFLGGQSLWIADNTDLLNAHELYAFKNNNPFDSDVLGDAIAVIGNSAFFVANDGTNGLQLWTSDGTATGTHMVADLALGTTHNSFNGSYVVSNGFSGLASTNGRLTMIDSVTGGGSVYAMNPDGSGFVRLLHGEFDAFGEAGGMALYVGSLGSGASQIYATDGTAAGTQVLANTLSQRGLQSVGTINGAVLFTQSTQTETDLMVTDGAVAGTKRVAVLNINPSSFSVVASPVAGGQVWFTAPSQGGGPTSLWVSDGTVGGTRLVDASFPQVIGLAQLDNKLVAFDASGNLYSADLSGANFTDLPVAVTVDRFVGQYGGREFFYGDSSGATQLWSTDGTAAGTVELTTNTLPEPASPRDFVTLSANAGSAPLVRLLHDTGASSTDGITSDARLVVIPANADDLISYSVDNVTTATYDPSTLADGAHSVTVTETHGGVAASTSLAFTLKTAAPVVTITSRAAPTLPRRAALSASPERSTTTTTPPASRSARTASSWAAAASTATATGARP